MCFDRRTMLRYLGATTMGVGTTSFAKNLSAARLAPKHEESIDRGLRWVALTQTKNGNWNAQNYPTAMTALAGLALLCSGSTTTQGPYARNIRRAVNFLFSKSRDNGLIGDPKLDNRYTYGHGFSMLFLSQVLGEEEDEDRRNELIEVLQKASQFSGFAQTKSGGWGYVSAADGSNFDEGSTTITQVQGLRGCRNAGIAVPAQIIERAKGYIYRCKNPDGGISYSSRNRGSSRPAITAAALAALYNAGDYDSKHVPDMMAYTKKQLYRLGGVQHFGHWHYTYLYYSQVVYREGGTFWEDFRRKISDRISSEQNGNGYWTGGNVGPIYITSINLIILQLERGFLPIFQR